MTKKSFAKSSAINCFILVSQWARHKRSECMVSPSCSDYLIPITVLFARVNWTSLDLSVKKVLKICGDPPGARPWLLTRKLDHFSSEPPHAGTTSLPKDAMQSNDQQFFKNKNWLILSLVCHTRYCAECRTLH